jgi:CheY-like chemotaxis protein
LDHRLPRKSGLDVVEILQNQGRFPSCPVVVLTSRLGNEQEKLSAMGVQAVLEKPFSLGGYLKVGEFLAGLCR